MTKFKWDILVNFQTMWNSSILLERRFSIWRTLVSIFLRALREPRASSKEIFMLNSIKLSVYFCNRNFSSTRVYNSSTSMKWIFYFTLGNIWLSNKNIEVLSAGFQFPFRASYPIRISGRNSLLSCCFCYLNYGTCFARERERLLFPRANSRKFCSFEID